MYIMINLDKKYTSSHVDNKIHGLPFVKSRFDGSVRLATNVENSKDLKVVELILAEVGLGWDKMWVL